MTLPEFLTQQPGESIRLMGHRIALEHVVYFYNQGYSPEMILGQFPSLPLGLIHKTIGFYLENQAEADAYVRRCEAEVAHQRAGREDPSDTFLRSPANGRSFAGRVHNSTRCSQGGVG